MLTNINAIIKVMNFILFRLLLGSVTTTFSKAKNLQVIFQQVFYIDFEMYWALPYLSYYTTDIQAENNI